MTDLDELPKRRFVLAEKAVRASRLRIDERRPEQSDLEYVPPEVFNPVCKKIREEMRTLRKAGKDPEVVRASVADRILAKAERKKK